MRKIDLQEILDRLFKLKSIVASGDLELIKKEVNNQLEVIKFNIKKQKEK